MGYPYLIIITPSQVLFVKLHINCQACIHYNLEQNLTSTGKMIEKCKFTIITDKVP